MLFYYMEILQYSCINQVVIMKVSTLQYKANPVCEFVTMKWETIEIHGALFQLAS